MATPVSGCQDRSGLVDDYSAHLEQRADVVRIGWLSSRVYPVDWCSQSVA
jgi:hypothetical protein